MKRLVKLIPFFLCLLLFYQNRSSSKSRENLPLTAKSYKTALPLKQPEFSSLQTNLQAPPDSVKNANLWEKLLDYLKIRKRANNRLDARIVSAIKSLGLKDSIAATSENVQLLIKEFRKRNSTDSLQAILNSVQQKQQGDNLENINPDNPNAAGEATPAEGSANEEASSFELEMLANQLIPLLEQKLTKEQNSKSKNEKIRLIYQVKNADPETVYELEEPGKKIRKYRLSLKSKAEVFGFFDAGSPAGTLSFLSSANSLIYYALPVNETTGSFYDLTNWHNASVVQKAQEMDAKVYFTMLVPHNKANSPLLHNPEVQNTCIKQIIDILNSKKINGIHVTFKNLAKKDRVYFTRFMQQIASALHNENPRYKLLLTIPRVDVAGAYDLKALKNYVDKFFIDFATQTSREAGGLAPLTGNSPYTIDSSVTYYTSQGIDADKMVIILPFRGTRWLINATSNKAYFLNYVGFQNIQKIKEGLEGYAENSQSMYLDISGSNERTYRIWYDNEFTLAKKFDYIIANKIGGVGLFFVNYDGPQNELTNELIYKFSYIDTVDYKDVVIKKTKDLPFLERQFGYLILWNYILQNPCATCFERSEEDVYKYLTTLKLDSLIRKERTVGAKQGIVTYYDMFNYLNNKLNNRLTVFVLFFGILSCVAIVYYVMGIKNNSDDWRNKKVTEVVLVVLISLFSFFLFTYCFTSDRIPLFGTSNSANGIACAQDAACVNIRFNTLLLIIFFGLILGFIYRYLYTAIFHKNDLP